MLAEKTDETKELFPISENAAIEFNPDPLLIREKIEGLEADVGKLPQIELPVEHFFSNGLYARQIFIPKGVILVGKIHAEEHINVVSKGDISVLTEQGMKRIQAPHTMISLPGTKRVGYAHEDTIWTTFHANPTNEMDVKKLEDDLTVKFHEELSVDVREKLILQEQE